MHEFTDEQLAAHDAEVAAAAEAAAGERIAAAIEGIEEFAKDITWETGEVLIPRDVAAHIARAGGES